MSIFGNIFNAILSGIGNSSQASQNSKDAKAAAAADKEKVQEAGYQERESYAFKSALDRYYSELDKQNKRDALKDYGSFNSLERFAPNYQATYVPPNLPTMPVNQRGGTITMTPEQINAMKNDGIEGNYADYLLNDGIEGNYERWLKAQK